MSMMPAAMSAEELMDRIGAPVLDPLKIGLRTAEMIAELAAPASAGLRPGPLARRGAGPGDALTPRSRRSL